ncbi:response regulator [Devriesea agamarum]|uniref:response regulator n=1 Tax=Devriesea agamarum TaxID=472569 RepID=UPI0009FE1849|nr:response regulator transcription factor [Devriesea agamarum]
MIDYFSPADASSLKESTRPANSLAPLNLPLSAEPPSGEGFARTRGIRDASPRRPLRVFIVDDHEIVRRGLVGLIASHNWFIVVGEAATAAQAIALVPRACPDVVLMDFRLPDGSGIDACRAIRSEHPQIPFVILTSYDDDKAMLSAVMAGASAYILKQVRGMDLLAVMEQVARGANLLPRDRIDAIKAKLTQSDPLHAPELAELTQRERDVLALVADGLTNRQIARRLDLVEKTVKNYVTSILSKLGMSSRTQAAVLVERLRSQNPG